MKEEGGLSFILYFSPDYTLGVGDRTINFSAFSHFLISEIMLYWLT
jgi:hypothetical protein